jgi:hypothetical protein
MHTNISEQGVTIQPTNDTYRAIKGVRLSEGSLQGNGYILQERLSALENEIEFSFFPNLEGPLFFVFGFRGVGNHYRLEFDPNCGRVFLQRFRDGMPVYLQHAAFPFNDRAPIRIRWSRVSIRIHLGELCILNVLAGEIKEGRWGFAGNGRDIPIPAVTVSHLPPSTFEWIILGDGYSNNRWKNREFYSWPELAFGDKSNYLNACVAAGNTRRVLEIVRQINSTFKGSRVILAVGADDFMEGEPFPEILERLREIVALIRSYGALEVHLCSLAPKPKFTVDLSALNTLFAEFSTQDCDSWIDFNSLWSDHSTGLLVHGDYPGPDAQRAMATEVLRHFQMEPRLAALDWMVRAPRLGGLTQRLAARINGELDHLLGRF